MIAVDFGTGDALEIFGDNGRIEKRSLGIARVKGGKSPRDEFRLVLEALLRLDNVVVESPTVGSSGCEVGDVVDILARSPHRLFTISARAVKNHRLDHKIPNPKSYGKYGTKPGAGAAGSHALDAEIMHGIAVDHPERLREWKISEPCRREYTSVRPMDKRGYRGKEAEEHMERLPRFSDLPAELQAIAGDGRGRYSRSLVMPFAMAMSEPYLHDDNGMNKRQRFEKLVGMYDHGYPSFYRRAVNTWMQKVAAKMIGLQRYKRDAVSREQRKAAWKITQRQLRHLFHLCEARLGQIRPETSRALPLADPSSLNAS